MTRCWTSQPSNRHSSKCFKKAQSKRTEQPNLEHTRTIRRTTLKQNTIVWALGLAIALTACTTPISTLGTEDNTFAASEATTSKTGIQTWAVSLNGENTSLRGLSGDQRTRQSLEVTPGMGKSFRITHSFFDANGSQVGSFEASIDTNRKPVIPVGSLNAALSSEVMTMTWTCSSRAKAFWDKHSDHN
jgi:hypothetical protein